MFCPHFRALMTKNVILLRRNWTGLCFEIVISFLCIIALVIFRKTQDKVLIPETSYLNSSQITLYPSLAMLYSDDYFSTIKNMSNKYNISFPFDNATQFRQQFFLDNTNLINVSSLENNILPFDFFGINASDLSSLVNIPSYRFLEAYKNARNVTDVLNNNNNFRTLLDTSKISDSNASLYLNNRYLDPSKLSYEDQVKLYNLVDNISQTNHFKNCHNPYLGGYIALSPHNAITEKIANLFAIIFYKSMYFNNDDEINSYVKSVAYNDQKVPRVCFAVSFKNLDDPTAQGYSYSLRFTQANPTHEVYETDEPWRTHPFKKEWLAKYGKYANYGFLALQLYIDNIIMKNYLNNSEVNLTAYINSVMTPTYYYDDLPGQLQGRSNIFTIIAYLLPFLKLIYFIMYEKEKKIKEGMKMMGMSESAFYVSWLLTYFLLFLFLTLINSMLLKIFIFTFSHYFLIFIVQLLYTVSLMFHGLLITVFFSRSKTAVVAGVFLIFIEYLLVQLVQKESVPYSSKIGGSLSPIIAMSLAADLFLEMEATENGITFDTVGVLFNNYNVNTAIAFFFVSSVLFLILFLYFNQVFPNEFGKKQHIFFFLPCCLKRRVFIKKETKYSHVVDVGHPDSNTAVSPLQKNVEEEPETFEKVGNALLQQKKEHKTVEIRGLTKIFPTGKKAVDNLSFTMYDNQIFVLLGVNGAGKTTTFSMLTGLIPQTSGSVTYFTHNMDTDMKEIRKIMGVCPQFDILFDDMTVKEHLELYACIKGMPKAEIPAAINKMIVDLKLEEKTNYQSKTLSGGQKRKLSTGIAFIGGSKLIFLDEPTTGMDPTNRRVLWDVLKMYKENKVIILTTHFMDEAEYLGDRIGIMGEGVLKCCGSDVFLKNLYGIGYNLSIIKENADENPEIFETIEKIVPGSKILSEASANLVLQLPMNQVGKFQELCQTLDTQRKKLKINSYGLSITSLEEVFLKVAQNRQIHENDEHKLKTEDREKIKKEDFILSDIRIKSKCKLYWGQFTALYIKRMHYMKRDWKSLFMEIFLPVLIMLIGIALLYATPLNDPPPLSLTPKTLYTDGFKVKISGLKIDEFMSYPEFQIDFFDSYQNATIWDQEIYNQRVKEQKGSLFISDFNKSEYDTSLNMTYFVEANTTSPDSGPMLVNQVNKATFRYLLNDPNFHLDVSNYPLAYSETDKENEFLEYQFFTAILFTLAFAFIPGSLVVFFVKERQFKMKHEQMVSGMKSWIYWIANFIFDLPKCLIPVICSLLIVDGFKVRSLSNEDCWEALWVLFILYIINIIPFTYFTSFFFEEYGYAQTVSFTVHLMISTVLTLVVGLLRILNNSRNAAKVLAYIFRIIPSFAFGYGTFNIANRKVYAFLDLYYEPKSPYDFEVAGLEMLYLGVTAFVMWALLIFFELTNEGERVRSFFADRKMKKLTNFRSVTMGKPQDQDIIDEKERLTRSESQDLLLKVVDMKKYFYVPYDQKKVKLAVDSLCLGTSKGDCFCLLGVNGAGKTTSFRMLTGEIKPDEGSISIDGEDAIKNPSKIRDKIGYCPQVDPLLDILSVEEHLYLFAGLKGIPNDMKKKLIEDKMQDLDLFRFRQVSSCMLSGGNKRKLSFAIATLGNPAIIFLDEPSSGMDPESRRFMWNAIAKFSGRNSKNSVILTTHLMEEAEALGTRIGIMVNGAFHCLGSAQYLKNRFGKGYELEIVTEIPSFEEMEQLAKICECGLDQMLNIDQVTQALNKLHLELFLNDFKRPEKTGYLFTDNEVKFEVLAEYIIIQGITNRIVENFNQSLGKCEVLEGLYSFFRLKVESPKPISYLFGEIESKKQKLQIKYYSIRQTTLEQIFNMFATGQIEEEDMDIKYPRNKSARPTMKAATLSRGFSGMMASVKSVKRESVSVFEQQGSQPSENKAILILKHMGTIGALALEEYNAQRTGSPKNKKKSLFDFAAGNDYIISNKNVGTGGDESVGIEVQNEDININEDLSHRIADDPILKN